MPCPQNLRTTQVFVVHLEAPTRVVLDKILDFPVRHVALTNLYGRNEIGPRHIAPITKQANARFRCYGQIFGQALLVRVRKCDEVNCVVDSG